VSGNPVASTLAGVQTRSVSALVAANRYLQNASFIVASGRSGSTLLRSLLDNHPQLVVWPFEWSYFTAFNEYAAGRPARFLVRDLVAHFRQTEFSQLELYAADLGGRTYQLDAINQQLFFEQLRQYDADYVTRREFLQLTMHAFVAALGRSSSPSRFVVTVNQPCDALLEDFPDARILAMIRNPLHTYVSVKRYYFKSADLSTVDRCAVYRPRAANSRFRYGLLETAVAPIVFTYDWIGRHRADARIHDVRLERLQSNPERVMREVADFLGVTYDPSLVRPTILGTSHGSNMSSGETSAGTIVVENLAESRKYAKDLTAYEFWWASQLVARAAEIAGYPTDENSPPARPGVKALLLPLHHEFPTRALRGKDGSLKRAARWAVALYSYVVNRRVLLRYSRKDVYAGWPYAT
jgi:protein-tyrosine sulfotransferase